MRRWCIPNLVECYACGRQSMPIFRADCIYEWVKNVNGVGELINVLCVNCWHNIIHYKRKYPMGFNYHLGHMNANWHGGVKALNDAIRTLKIYKKWKSMIRKRDGNRCVECDSRNTLHVHHKKSISDIVKHNRLVTTIDAINCSELWDMKNGITLCDTCHAKVDANWKKFYKK